MLALTRQRGKAHPSCIFSTHLRVLAFSFTIGSQAIENGLATRDMLLRMLATARLRDPDETGPHVMRVGAMAGELYHRWAEKNAVEMTVVHKFKSQVRLASMLHDVGKVGISDTILKKPGRLTPEERLIMEKHTAIGSALFKDAKRDIDVMDGNIALNNHQKWDGTR